MKRWLALPAIVGALLVSNVYAATHADKMEYLQAYLTFLLSLAAKGLEAVLGIMAS